MSKDNSLVQGFFLDHEKGFTAQCWRKFVSTCYVISFIACTTKLYCIEKMYSVIACHQDTSYLANFFEKINTTTNKLQSKNITLVQSKSIIYGPINKLELYQQTLSRRDFHHFSRLSKMSHSITDRHLLIYVAHLKVVNEGMHVRSKDLLDLEVSTVGEPFASNINKCNSTMQEMLMDLQSDEEARADFGAHEWGGFWIKCNN